MGSMSKEKKSWYRRKIFPPAWFTISDQSGFPPNDFEKVPAGVEAVNFVNSTKHFSRFAFYFYS